MIKLAPPFAALPRIFKSFPSDFKKPLITGPGPTYATSTEFEKIDSMTCGPLSKTFISILRFSSRFSANVWFSIPTIGTA